MKCSVVGIAAVTIALGAAMEPAWARVAEQKLYLNGKVASTNIIVQNGVAYVPIKDIAAALDMSAEKRADGYALVKAGGANQVEGVQGKIGDELFNGLYRVKVVKVTRQESYTRQFSKGDAVTAPNGQEVVAVVLKLKNGTKQSQLIDLVYPGSNTGLTDSNGQSYGPVTGLASDTPSRAATLLPGAAVDSALVFFVPKGIAFKDLVFQMGNNPSGPAFRISLKDSQ